MSDTTSTIEDDRRLLADAPPNSDDWDDATWAAWFRAAARAHGGRFDGDTKAANPTALLTAILHSARWAVILHKQGQAGEAGEHIEGIERLITAYRDAVQVDQPGVVGNELVVQILDKEGRWRDWRAPMPGLFLDHGRQQLAQARLGVPEREFRLVRRTTVQRVEEIVDEPAVDGGA
jgi:hypothetical protein